MTAGEGRRRQRQAVVSFLTMEDLAERWATTTAALWTRRYRGDMPAGYRNGRRILFRLDEVEQWEEALRDEPKGAA